MPKKKLKLHKNKPHNKEIGVEVQDISRNEFIEFIEIKPEISPQYKLNNLPRRDRGGKEKKSLNGQSCRYCGKHYLIINLLKSHEMECVKVKTKNKKSNNINNSNKSYDDDDDDDDDDGSSNIIKAGSIINNKAESISKSKTTIENIKYVCEICHQAFKFESNLNKHKGKHLYPGGFKCTYCYERFQTNELRLLHKEREHRFFKCKLCAVKHESKEELSNHILKAHDGKIREHVQCPDCGSQFSSTNLLRQHNKSKCSTEKSFACDKCCAKFMSKHTLHAHEKIHFGEKKHLCNFCGNIFLSKGQLKVHERCHTGEKPFKCEICHKAFSYRESLVTHSSVHTGIKPYICECCSNRFSCIGNLIKHRKSRPDTCGLPQYSKNKKIAPRPSSKSYIKKSKPQIDTKINNEQEKQIKDIMHKVQQKIDTESETKQRNKQLKRPSVITYENNNNKYIKKSIINLSDELNKTTTKLNNIQKYEVNECDDDDDDDGNFFIDTVDYDNDDNEIMNDSNIIEIKGENASANHLTSISKPLKKVPPFAQQTPVITPIAENIRKFYEKKNGNDANGHGISIIQHSNGINVNSFISPNIRDDVDVDDVTVHDDDNDDDLISITNNTVSTIKYSNKTSFHDIETNEINQITDIEQIPLTKYLKSNSTEDNIDNMLLTTVEIDYVTSNDLGEITSVHRVRQPNKHKQVVESNYEISFISGTDNNAEYNELTNQIDNSFVENWSNEIPSSSYQDVTFVDDNCYEQCYDVEPIEVDENCVIKMDDSLHFNKQIDNEIPSGSGELIKIIKICDTNVTTDDDEDVDDEYGDAHIVYSKNGDVDITNKKTINHLKNETINQSTSMDHNDELTIISNDIDRLDGYGEEIMIDGNDESIATTVKDFDDFVIGNDNRKNEDTDDDNEDNNPISIIDLKSSNDEDEEGELEEEKEEEEVQKLVDIDDDDDNYENYVNNPESPKVSIEIFDKDMKAAINFSCTHCPKKYIHKKSYFKHLKSVHNIESIVNDEILATPKLKPYECKYCNKQYINSCILEKHIKRHGKNGELLHKCSYCFKHFVSVDEAKKHQLNEHKYKVNVNCTKCEKVFSCPEYLTKHMQNVHNESAASESMEDIGNQFDISANHYVCPRCGKTFTSKVTLNDHERSDCGRTPLYECDVCKKRYHSSGSLKTHKTIHSGTLSHLCKFCGKAFRTQGQVKIHERKHNGEKPFACNYCTKAFAYRESLLTHLSLHTGIKRFMCQSCGARFSCISNLQAHRRSHRHTCGTHPNTTKAIFPTNIKKNILNK